MKFNRYKNKNWESAYRQSRVRMAVLIKGEGCNNVAAHEAQYFLKAHYRGPWKMIAAITKRELMSDWDHYGWVYWEWVRTKIFRRPQDEVIAAFEAEEAEHKRVENLLHVLQQTMKAE